MTQDKLMLKHYYVSYADPTVILTDTNMVQGGKTHPNVIGLDVLIQSQDSSGIDYCLSTAPISSNVQVPGVAVLSAEQWIQEWIAVFETTKHSLIKQTYIDYKAKFEALPDPYYHPHEMLYSNYIKRAEAAQIRGDMTEEEIIAIAPVVYKEASERGVSAVELAAKILLHASTFDNAQASLLAERGRKIDSLVAAPVNSSSSDTVLESIRQLYAIIN